MKKLSKDKSLKSNFNLKKVQFLSISDFNDIRYIFGSKEWISSYLSVVKPKELFPITVKVRKNFNLSLITLQKLNGKKNILVPVGTPYNDCNFILPTNIKNKYNLEFRAVSILKQLENLINLGYKINIDLLFDHNEVNILNNLLSKTKSRVRIIKSPTPSVRCIYKDILGKTELVEKNFSKKLLKRVRHQIRVNQFTLRIIRGTDQNYPKALKNLLFHRRANFFLKNKEDPILAFSSKFNRLINTFTQYQPVKLRTIIFELFLREKYVASDLFFYYKNIYLCYLRAFNNKLSNISPGMILCYLTHKMLANQAEEVVIDYTRGDESYKFRIGGKKTTLKKLIFN